MQSVRSFIPSLIRTSHVKQLKQDLHYSDCSVDAFGRIYNA